MVLSVTSSDCASAPRLAAPAHCLEIGRGVGLGQAVCPPAATRGNEENDNVCAPTLLQVAVKFRRDSGHIDISSKCKPILWRLLIATLGTQISQSANLLLF